MVIYNTLGEYGLEKFVNKILEAFSPLLERNVLPLLQELDSEDRVIFDGVVLEAFELKLTQRGVIIIKFI